MKLSFNKLSPKGLTSFICLAYIIIIFCIYPLYMEEGYVKISDAKFYFYLYTSLGAVLLLVLTGLVTLLKQLSRFSITDIFVLLFSGCCILSYFFSDYKSTAFLGFDGWYVGLLTLLLVTSLFLLISKLYEYEDFVLYPILLISSLVFLIGILDRFSLYLLPLEIRNTSFLSTMGNINWFAGYYSVLCPLGVGLFVLELSKKERSKARMIFLLITSLITFAFGFAQGAESVLLVWFALFFGLFLFSKMGMIPLENVILTTGLWSFSGELIRLFRKYAPGAFNYGSGGLLDQMTQKPIMLIVFLAVLALWILVYKLPKVISSEKKVAVEKIIYTSVLFIFIVLPLLWIIAALLNTFALESPFIDYDIFILDESFGSGRGHALKAAFMIIKEMSLKDWLFGVGPDCFSSFAYEKAEINAYLRQVWPNDILPNAHCELLTVFINEGLLGLISFIGIFVSFLIRGMRYLKKDFCDLVMCITLSVTAYMVHNLVSFTQILNIPFLLILMGMTQSQFLTNMQRESKIKWVSRT